MHFSRKTQRLYCGRCSRLLQEQVFARFVPLSVAYMELPVVSRITRKIDAVRARSTGRAGGASSGTACRGQTGQARISLQSTRTDLRVFSGIRCRVRVLLISYIALYRAVCARWASSVATSPGLRGASNRSSRGCLLMLRSTEAPLRPTRRTRGPQEERREDEKARGGGRAAGQREHAAVFGARPREASSCSHGAFPCPVRSSLLVLSHTAAHVA